MNTAIEIAREVVDQQKYAVGVCDECGSYLARDAEISLSQAVLDAQEVFEKISRVGLASACNGWLEKHGGKK